jgi:membrane protein DedA with SNARE-associated domain
VAEKYFRDHGVVSTLVGRLIPAVRQLISIPAGLAKMKLHVFLLFTAIGAGLWNVVLAALGYFLHRVVPKEELIPTVEKYSHEIGIGIIIVVALVIAYLVARHFIKKKKSQQ